MIESLQSSSFGLGRRMLYGRSELRAGWRLCIFLVVVVALIACIFPARLPVSIPSLSFVLIGR